ncbi:hypothetical protein [Paludifilum halophilum]|uniref:Helicase XPB/Ssl2 N-terminal domain-containing protein n=1 Tax=Paludifilum halophilum TaxID=1642702 RepID=A0A235BBL9_9BACL|nr:hypothetical protein [Paludifilum halophilum]OYD09708.1 hypothetical protein CHM34_01520 [Paludifilum halophilum]
MNFADLLTYADIETLKRMADHYDCGNDFHSKNGLISSLLHHLGKPSRLKGEVESLHPAEFRFLQQLCFDSREVFSREELIGKGRAALEGDGDHPRRLVLLGCKKGWLFPGVSHRDKSLFQVPRDLRRRFLELLSEKYAGTASAEQQPVAYRNEEGLMQEDLHRFLFYLCQHEVRLTSEGGIYRQQQRQIFKALHVAEEPVPKKGWRFGFGRRYHLYPDRFSLLYDYAFYRGYILEDEMDGILRLSEAGAGKIENKDPDEGKEIYRFWLRLYKKPIRHIALLVKWIDLLCRNVWQEANRVETVVRQWLEPYYYESEADLFQRTIKMMVHLGLLRIGEGEDRCRLLRMNHQGHIWVSGVAGFAEKSLENQYSEPVGGKLVP